MSAGEQLGPVSLEEALSWLGMEMRRRERAEGTAAALELAYLKRIAAVLHSPRKDAHDLAATFVAKLRAHEVREGGRVWFRLSREEAQEQLAAAFENRGPSDGS